MTRPQTIIPFETMAALQASAVLLKAHADQMSRLRLLKLLYIANRTSLAETLEPIVGDRIESLDHGPVPYTVHRLLKGQHPESRLWDQYIQQAGPQEHRLASDPGVGRLSSYSIDKLRAVSDERRGKNDYEIAVETQSFPEWQQNQPKPGTHRWISVDDLLSALNLQGAKGRIAESAADDAAFEQAMARVQNQATPKTA